MATRRYAPGRIRSTFARRPFDATLVRGMGPAAPGREWPRMSDRRSQSRWRAWAELLRLPNLLTVPGDPLAGAALAAGALPVGGVPAAVWAAAAALCLYAGGLALNDVADLEEDRRERPRRPLPSGRIAPGAALAAGLALLAAGVGFAFAAGRQAGLVGAGLAALIAAYDFALKRTPFGPAAMGACRAMSLLMGAAAVAPSIGPRAAVAALGLGSYVAALTVLSRRETGGRTSAAPAAGPAAAVVFAAAAMLILAPRNWACVPAPALVFALAAVLAARAGRDWHAAGDPARRPPCIGRMVRNLTALQAAFVLASPAPPSAAAAAAIALLAAGFLHGVLARRIAAS